MATAPLLKLPRWSHEQIMAQYMANNPTLSPIANAIPTVTIPEDPLVNLAPQMYEMLKTIQSSNLLVDSQYGRALMEEIKALPNI